MDGADVQAALESVGVIISTIYQGEEFRTFGTVRVFDEEEIQNEDATIPAQVTVARVQAGTLPGMAAGAEVRVGDARTKYRVLYTRRENPGILLQLYLTEKV